MVFSEISIVRVRDSGITFGEWSLGPQLFTNIPNPTMAVAYDKPIFYLVAGEYANRTYSDRIYSLRWPTGNEQPNSAWEELPFTLPYGYRDHVAMFVPVEYEQLCE